MGKVKGRRRVVRRFGWSNESEADAQRHADERALAALQALQAGKPVAGRELKLRYGDEVLPIREEVIARNGDDVVTRNGYGSRCLNEPDVLFADLDDEPRLPEAVERLLTIVQALVTLGALGFGIWMLTGGRWLFGCAGLFACVFLPLILSIGRLSLRRSAANRAAHRRRADDRLAAFVADRPGCRYALYETPAGQRLLCLHRTYDPRSEEVAALFAALRTDPAYVRLCKLQGCFRSRVSAKPWRVGLSALRPRNIWPVPFEQLGEREDWVAEYEAKALGFAACRYVQDLGDGPVHPRCRHVQKIHDDLCRARSGLPIA